VRLVASALCAGVLVHGAESAHAATAGRTFYLDPAGDDSADGLTPDTAWHSLAKASAFSFQPGDRLLLRGGAVFPGTLRFGTGDSLSGKEPLIVGSFAAGRAMVAALDDAAIVVHNTAGIEIRDLVLTGPANRRSDGIMVYNETADYLDTVSITHVDVSGFKNGISIGGPEFGFRNVHVTASQLHDNVEAGLITYGPEFTGRYANRDITVSAVEAYRNSGDRENLIRNTGNGIVLGSVDGGKVEFSEAYDNGAECFAPEGPAGIWSYDSRAVVIEHNVAHHNRSGTGADGDGFDLDQNTSSSVLQFNLAYDNDGAGYLLYAGRDGTTNRDNVVRHNVSRDSVGTTDLYGAVTVIGHVTDAQVYGNTLAVGSSTDLRPPAIRLHGPLSGVSLTNNVASSDNAGPLVAASSLSHGQVTMRGNTYHGRPEWRVQWGEQTYRSLDTWRSETGQESPA
jgi:Right handed beta helix region